MKHTLLVSVVILMVVGAGACSGFKPHDYSGARQGETSEAGIARHEREARTEQQRVVRCETMGQAARRDAPECR